MEQDDRPDGIAGDEMNIGVQIPGINGGIAAVEPQPQRQKISKMNRHEVIGRGESRDDLPMFESSAFRRGLIGIDIFSHFICIHRPENRDFSDGGHTSPNMGLFYYIFEGCATVLFSGGFLPNLLETACPFCQVEVYCI